MNIINHKRSFGLLVMLLLASSPAMSELEELDEQALEAQTGKEGITIDMAFKWEIGEIYIDLNGSAKDKPAPPAIQAPVNTPQKSQIHYVLPD